MLFLGDTVPNRPFDFSPSFARLCAEHDSVIFNLEGAFSRRRKALFKAGPTILLEEEYFAPLARHFNVAILANNHSMDFGKEGLETTISLCRKNGIDTVGAGMNLYEAFSPLDIGGCRIISVAENEFGAAYENQAGIATVDRPLELFKKIKEGQAAGLFVVVVAHGGTEKISIPPPYLRDRYKLWIEFGADAVVGNHPHVVQGFELYRDKPIFYSLGNFVFLNNEFKECPNAWWSIAVSIDTRDRGIRIIPVVADNDGVIRVSNEEIYRKEFNRLCTMLASQDYQALYDQLASDHYSLWYSRLGTKSKEDAALLLHYLRCDAHRNMVENALSQKIDEVKPATRCSNSTMQNNNGKMNCVRVGTAAGQHNRGKHAAMECRYKMIKIRPDSMDDCIIEEIEKDPYHVTEYVRDNDYVLDVGAYNGTFALFVKKEFSSAKIICLEPIPDNFAVLKENVGGAAIIEQIALVGRPGPIVMYDFGIDASACHSIYNVNPNKGTPVTVTGDTLSNVLHAATWRGSPSVS